jgi:hypothetical protein
MTIVAYGMYQQLRQNRLRMVGVDFYQEGALGINGNALASIRFDEALYDSAAKQEIYRLLSDWLNRIGETVEGTLHGNPDHKERAPTMQQSQQPALRSTFSVKAGRFV